MTKYFCLVQRHGVKNHPMVHPADGVVLFEVEADATDVAALVISKPPMVSVSVTLADAREAEEVH